MYLKTILIIFVSAFCSSFITFAQNDKQKELELLINKIKNSHEEIPWNDLEHLSDFINVNPSLDYSSKELVPLLIKYLAIPISQVEPEIKTNYYSFRALRFLSKLGIPISSDLGEALNSNNEALCGASLYTLAFLEEDNRKNFIPKILKLCRHENGDVREYATLALFRIGGSTPEIISELTFQLGDFAYNRNLARSFLKEIGIPAIPYLIQALENENEEIRRFAAVTLRDIGSIAREAIPALLVALKDEYDLAQDAIEKALLKIATDKTELTLNLIKIIKSENFRTRKGAIEILEKLLYVKNKEIFYVKKKDSLFQEIVVPLIIEALKDERWEVRSAATSALGAVQFDWEKVVLLLTEMLQDKEWQVRKSAIVAFGSLSPPKATILPPLLKGLEDEYWEVREASARVLTGRVGGKESIQSFSL